MNEVVAWARGNARLLAASAAALLVLSVLVGILVGRARRADHGGAEALLEAADPSRVKSAQGAAVAPEGMEASDPRLLPPPIALDVTAESGSFSFVLDEPGAVLAGMEPAPLRISELLANRAADVEPDFEVFVYDNQELDVLIRRDALAEP